MDALQFLKRLIYCDLVFHADPTEPLDSDTGEEYMHGRNSLVLDANQSPSWDELWLEDGGDAITEG